MPEFCGFGGYCLRIAGHDGACTRTPLPGTRDWDERRAALMHENRVLAELDFETPWWADLNDPE